MKCCVTGADGYLGKGIVSKLLDEGAEVVASGFRLADVFSTVSVDKIGVMISTK